MTRGWAVAAAATFALALPACSDDDSSGDSTQRAQTVERTTRVEVLRRVGDAEGGFDPREIYEHAAPGVVTVFSVFKGGALFGGGRDQQGVGSGFVLDGEGEIATNAHVIADGEGGDIEKAAQVYVQFADGNQVGARIVGYDPNSDVALLRIATRGLTLRPLPLGRSAAVEVGEPVAAIGSPYNQPQSLSVGVVSAKDRSIESLTGFTIPGALQTDAAVNRGNSGGPLVNAEGEVIGINSQIRSTGGGGEGVGFAVPVDTVRRVLATLRRDGKIEYAFVGVSTAPVYPQLAERFGLHVKSGAWVQELTADGPAEDAGLHAGDDEERFQGREYTTGGDVISKVEGRPLRGPDDLGAELTRYKPGQKVTLEVWRGDERRMVEVTLGRRPVESRPQQPQP